MYAKKNRSMKLVALVLVLALLIGGVVGGTIAWLVTQSNVVVNTFTVGNIKITLTETGATTSGDKSTKEFKMVPGTKLAKDPVVTVNANSEDCWLFVKIEEAGAVTVGEGEGATTYNFDGFITYTVDTAANTGWTKVDVEGADYELYARSVKTSDKEQSFNILTGEGDDNLKNGYVTVNTTVTKEMMEALDKDGAVKPTLTFTAYAIQSENLTKNGTAVSSAADAWAVYQNPDGTSEDPETNE